MGNITIVCTFEPNILQIVEFWIRRIGRYVRKKCHCFSRNEASLQMFTNEMLNLFSLTIKTLSLIN